jgi:hypothetical protein
LFSSFIIEQKTQKVNAITALDNPLPEGRKSIGKKERKSGLRYHAKATCAANMAADLQFAIISGIW